MNSDSTIHLLSLFAVIVKVFIKKKELFHHHNNNGNTLSQRQWQCVSAIVTKCNENSYKYVTYWFLVDKILITSQMRVFKRQIMNSGW